MAETRRPARKPRAAAAASRGASPDAKGRAPRRGGGASSPAGASGGPSRRRAPGADARRDAPETPARSGKPGAGSTGSGGRASGAGHPSGTKRTPGTSRAPGASRPSGTRRDAGRGSARPPQREVPVVPVVRRGTAQRKTAAPAGGVADQSQKLQKVLAQAGLGSRREMEELIKTGKVLVNGLPATLGMRVNPDDAVKVGRRHLRFSLSTRLPRVIIYHKPEGEIVSRSDPEGRASVYDRLPVIRSGKWLAIGRLDFNTCGLLIFTTSGELANRLTHPRFEVEREYAVRILGELDETQARKMVTGIELTDGKAHFDVLQAEGGEGRNRWYRVVVREGRNRLVRRMFEHFGFTVSRLMRVRFGIVNLPPRLKRGQYLELTEAQTRSVLDWLASDGQPAEATAPPS